MTRPVQPRPAAPSPQLTDPATWGAAVWVPLLAILWYFAMTKVGGTLNRSAFGDPEALLRALVLGAIIECALAWLLAWGTLRMGAPRSIWMSLAMVSIAALGVLIAFVLPFDSALPGMPLRVAAISVSLVGPPVIAFLEGRRQRRGRITNQRPST